MSEEEIFGTDVIGGDFGNFEAEIFGATMPPQPQPPQQNGPFITIHVKDVPALVKAKGGSIGGLVAGLLPQTIEAKVYGDMASQFKEKLKEQGVDADVAVVTAAPFGGPFKRDFLIGGAVGVGMVGVGFGLFKLIKHFIGRK